MTLNQLVLYNKKLQQLEKKERLRILTKTKGIDFTSNDYLSLASSKRLNDCIIDALNRDVPIGAGGSRLLRGNHHEHETLEHEASVFFGSEKVLYFSSGYVANIAVLSTLPQPQDIIFHDILVHASAYAGMQSGKAKTIPIPHNNVNAFEDAISQWRKRGGKGTPWIVVESLYSMDGDKAPLHDLLKLANQYNGFLFIDEAHATGIYGANGYGFTEDLHRHENVLVLHTCGKALGVSGALLGANKLLCNYIINYAKPFIYTTAPSPLEARIVREALKIVKEEPERREKLHDLISFTDRLFNNIFGFSSGSQIQPIIIGKNDYTIQIAQRMQKEGFDVRAIRPPTVPIGTSRLRISITLNVNTEIIQFFVDQLKQIMSEIIS
ncbi:8-amino-7-oxononanoate synthase [Liberibacter crescens BT-1]|uniref:8-amino-7-oxononanoate synthase n=1 Tax=Liberibacter crescens (strain BT-1) TaxID=1215343 RepID=L0EWH7_LIBCB|nr:8-amino-7-oxononanoate synthase [Liberibacter crescens]AGA65317.1 8-amino-7-oxononanoate synthase [Liberibacter crescens BT-1]AMC13246.1 8-amino-7-oxononanoate synthase [Liberibacter crescens]